MLIMYIRLVYCIHYHRKDILNYMNLKLLLPDYVYIMWHVLTKVLRTSFKNSHWDKKY